MVGPVCHDWFSQDMPPRPLLHMVFPLYQASEALTLCALHLIVVTSYRISFLLRCEWNQSFHPAVLGKLVGIFRQTAFLVHQRGILHSQDMMSPRFAWSSFADFWAIGYEEGLKMTLGYATPRYLL